MVMKVVSLFSGAMGLDLGLEAAGHEVVVAVETDSIAVETIRLNRPDLPVIARSIEHVTTAEILKAAKLKVGDDFIVVGGPCCQAFSTVGKRASLSDPRGSLFRHFARVVRQARPTFFLMENVRGLLSAAELHRPLNKRGPGHPRLKDSELLGSAFASVVLEFRKLGYYTIFDVLNAADYGTPQKRERFIAMGSREGHPLAMPAPTHAAEATEGRSPWISIRDAIGKKKPPTPPEFMALSATQQKYFPMIPPGGDWRDLPLKYQRKALGTALDSWGGRTGFLRRLSWDRPSPSLVTTPNARATLLGHPAENRPLSLYEYARIQEFPNDWKFAGSRTAQYRQIGNAVPVGLGRALGQAINGAYQSKERLDHRGVFCFNELLLERLSRRPATVLNPPRQRKNGSAAAATHWKKDVPKSRTTILEKINVPIRRRTKPGRLSNASEARIHARPTAARAPSKKARAAMQRTRSS